jgi:tryptophan synthase alpha chain
VSLADAFADQPAFVPYLAAGDPSPAATKAYVSALVRGGADVVELGLPFSEPIAEGPTIQSAVFRALDSGMTPDAYLDLVADHEVDEPNVSMTYYNLVYQYGTGEGPRPFVERAAEVGIEGFVIPDLPAEEAGPLREACDEFGLDRVFIVAPTTRGERLERIMAQVSGYVYVQARLGTTGAREDVSDRTTESLARVSEFDADIPKAVGFGISEGEHAREVVAAGADGVIVGSALIDVIAAGDDVEATAERLEAKARELKEGALTGASAHGENQPQPERT